LEPEERLYLKMIGLRLARHTSVSGKRINLKRKDVRRKAVADMKRRERLEWQRLETMGCEQAPGVDPLIKFE